MKATRMNSRSIDVLHRPLLQPISPCSTVQDKHWFEEPRYEIGQSFEFSRSGRVSFAQLVYPDSFQEYKMSEIGGMTRGTEFIFWKTDEEPQKTPTFDECKSEVEEYVKRAKAEKH